MFGYVRLLSRKRGEARSRELRAQRPRVIARCLGRWSPRASKSAPPCLIPGKSQLPHGSCVASEISGRRFPTSALRPSAGFEVEPPKLRQDLQPQRRLVRRVALLAPGPSAPVPLHPRRQVGKSQLPDGSCVASEILGSTVVSGPTPASCKTPLPGHSLSRDFFSGEVCRLAEESPQRMLAQPGGEIFVRLSARAH